jgi:hypothetical protein
MKLLVNRFAEALKWIDQTGIPFKNFHPGVGPYGEPQLLKKSLGYLIKKYPNEFKDAKTKRNPDIYIPGNWAIEFKIVRPFGDNGKEAEHWSQNLLHPYPGNVSSIGDIYKLLNLAYSERKGIIVFTFENDPPNIDLDLIVECFEHISINVLSLPIKSKHIAVCENLIHPIHKRSRVFGWELFGT